MESRAAGGSSVLYLHCKDILHQEEEGADEGETGDPTLPPCEKMWGKKVDMRGLGFVTVVVLILSVHFLLVQIKA